MIQAIPTMTTLRDLIREGQGIPWHQPWPRVVVDRESWERAISLMQDGRCSLLGLWGEKERVHMALVGEGEKELGILTLACNGNRFPSVGRLHAPATSAVHAVVDALEKRQQAFEQRNRRRGATADVQVNGQDGRNAANAGIAPAP